MIGLYRLTIYDVAESFHKYFSNLSQYSFHHSLLSLHIVAPVCAFSPPPPALFTTVQLHPVTPTGCLSPSPQPGPRRSPHVRPPSPTRTPTPAPCKLRILCGAVLAPAFTRGSVIKSLCGKDRKFPACRYSFKTKRGVHGGTPRTERWIRRQTTVRRCKDTVQGCFCEHGEGTP